jgi:hypothetical protein
MVRVRPEFERVAARLRLHELSAEDDDDADDLLAARTAARFVDTYSVDGLRLVMDAYGLQAALHERGLGDCRVRVSRDDAFRHRLELLLDDDRRVMDMRLHLQELALPAAQPVAFSVVVVDWLLMQHPGERFSSSRPRLPGQAWPGTGLGRQVHDLLVLLCRRIGRDALLNTPERFHLAALYRRAGYRSLDDDGGAGVDAALAAGRSAGLSFAALTWAVERGFVRCDGGAWAYHPAPHLFAVSERAERWVRRLPAAPPGPSVTVDVAGLRQSLRDDPVDGVEIPL